MICNDNEFKVLLRLIKSESYGMIRHRSLRPSLSAKDSRNLLRISRFLSFCKNCSPLLLPLPFLRLFKCFLSGNPLKRHFYGICERF